MLTVVWILLCFITLRCASFEWGKSFDGVVQTENVKFDCTFNGYPTCCALLQPVKNMNVGGEFNSKNGRSSDPLSEACTLTKKYRPSPYEEIHLAKAYKLDKITSLKKRRRELTSFINSDVDASNIWLDRVKEHMTSSTGCNATKADFYYLSRFEVTKSCTGKYASLSKKWVEWIEPLTVHARHPFSMKPCKPEVYSEQSKQKMRFNASLVSTDYVLIKSDSDLRRATSLSHRSHHPSISDNITTSSAKTQHRNFLFDAGTSTFESSLLWFLCAYLQRGISFDQIYGFEYTLLEPQDFWRHVPDSVKPHYHFYNAPISAGAKDALSPLRFIREVAPENDFVSFKLDVDTASVEIPQALALLVDPELNKLVDEFFFELHFRCEIMTTCGWEESDLSDDYGIQLDRSHALQFFHDMRMLGIRAHIWP